MASTAREIGMGFLAFKGVSFEYERQMNELLGLRSSSLG